MKEKIVVIGANSFQNCLILKAKELGYETHVFSWQCGDIGESTADYFYPISIIEKERILEKCRYIKPVAVVSIGSDLAVLTVNYIARELGLIANSARCDLVATNKYEMRNSLMQAGIPTPRYIKVTEHSNVQEVESFHYPLIVKPTDRSGSRGITKIEKGENIETAIKDSIEQSFEQAAIVEEFIEGKEYSCEGISFAGQHYLLAFTEKFTTGAPHFIEVGHVQPAQIDEKKKEKIRETVLAALDALDIKYGASHTEFKIDSEGNVGIIEVGARMGGDCIGSDLVMLTTGNDFIKMVIDVSCGKEPVFSDRNDNTNAAVRFIMKKEDLKLLKADNSIYSVKRVSEIDKTFSGKMKDSSSRYGYFLVTSDNRDKLEEYLFGEDDEEKS